MQKFVREFIRYLFDTRRKFPINEQTLVGRFFIEYRTRFPPSFIAFGQWFGHIYQHRDTRGIFPQCNYVPGWNRLGPIVAQFQGGWRFVMGRVTGRDTAYRDKPCRRPDYGFQPSPRDRPLFPSQPPRNACSWNDRVPNPEIFRLAIATRVACTWIEIRVTSRKWSVFFLEESTFKRSNVGRKFIRDLLKFNFLSLKMEGRVRNVK